MGASGDHIYQIIDVCSLGVVAGLLHHILVVKRHTYQAEEGSLPILHLAIGALWLAGLLQGNMNG